ncbi:autophagy-related protein 16-1 isoform X2 [Odontomachus brunneus]|uniref:autophagy-related protein 16-1 isoform X2 n=1 Tax=Odontomachus brunneus TaxID=486640 RepID=UPI0013F292AC|nr:autophagy-related protein 16-1 isoform X2 [Odontomachus brunneus]
MEAQATNLQIAELYFFDRLKEKSDTRFSRAKMTTLEAGVSLVAREDINWRKDLISQLRERNRSQTNCFADLISLHNRLFENANTLRGANMQLTIANETLRREVASGSIGLGGNPDLEARLLKQAEELAMLHKRKGEHTQQIVDLNNKLQEMAKELHAKDISLAESHEVNTNLRIDITKCLGREKELEGINQMLKDEHQALQLAFASLEEKLRKTQEENRQLIERLIKYKARDAEKMNEENDNFLSFTSPTTFLMNTLSKFGKRQAKMQKELEDAARDTRPVSPDRSSLKEGIAGLPTAVPTNVSVTFNAHDGEVYAVKWSPTDRILLATGGADRKVKLWNIAKGASESKGILVGSNAGVMSVDFDSTGTLILGASNDYASRVWTVSDLRLKVSFTQLLQTTETIRQDCGEFLLERASEYLVRCTNRVFNLASTSSGNKQRGIKSNRGKNCDVNSRQVTSALLHQRIYIHIYTSRACSILLMLKFTITDSIRPTRKFYDSDSRIGELIIIASGGNITIVKKYFSVDS